ncbi:MAG: efflux RND transporter permease subunit, partial [Pseudomonadota bacterium]
MNLPEISVKRHVLAYMMSALFILFGVISFNQIGVDRYPQVELPMIGVSTIMPGASPEIVDSSITSVIESAVNSIPGIENINSRSMPSTSLVTIEFSLDRNQDTAFNEVQAKVNQILNQLPEDSEQPVVAKLE